MDEATKEILFDLISDEFDNIRIPTPVAWDEEAVDWLFYVLHSRDYGLSTVSDFLGKHFPADPRFVLWKNRAFRPNAGEDGMLSKNAFRFTEKHEPNHPWLIPFMEQMVCCSGWSIEGFNFGKDFRSYLRGRFEQMLGDNDGSSGIPLLLPESRRLPRETVESMFRSDDDGYHGATLQGTLTLLDSPIPGEVAAALKIAGTHLYQAEEITTRLIEMARTGNSQALLWIARRYPESPAAWQVLANAIDKAHPDHKLVELMCLQETCLPEIRDRFLTAFGDLSATWLSDYGTIPATRSERKKLRDEVFNTWKRFGFSLSQFAFAYPMWFPWESVMEQIVERIESGELLKNSRTELLQISVYTDISEALRNGIRVAADRIDMGDAILLLGMIYGDRPETVRFLKEFIEYEPAMLKYGAEAAFAEVLRLGKRDEPDFEWAVNVLENSRNRPGGVAGHGPALLVHFFGSGSSVRETLQRFATSSGNRVLADASARLLLDRFPTAVPDKNRSAVERLSSSQRADYLASMFSQAEEHLDDLIHFSLHDPEPAVRRAALGSISQALSWNKLPDTWRDRDFATRCLDHKELTRTAAGMLAKWYPEDETVARLLIPVAERFPEEGIFRTLVDSFGHTGAVRELLFEVIRKSRNAATALVERPRCTCSKCLGFDLKEYSISVLRLFLPPYDQLPEAAEYRQQILTDPWLDPNDPWRFIRAITHGLDDAGRIRKYEELIRSDALLPRKQWTLNALAQSAENDDPALELLLRLMDDPDENLRVLAGKSAKSISYNGRRYHRKLHELLRQQGLG